MILSENGKKSSERKSRRIALSYTSPLIQDNNSVKDNGFLKCSCKKHRGRRVLPGPRTFRRHKKALSNKKRPTINPFTYISVKHNEFSKSHFSLAGALDGGGRHPGGRAFKSNVESCSAGTFPVILKYSPRVTEFL